MLIRLVFSKSKIGLVLCQIKFKKEISKWTWKLETFRGQGRNSFRNWNWLEKYNKKNDILTRDEEWWYNKAALWIAKIHQNTTSGLMSCFLRSKRLTGRLAVVIVSVKPFAKIVGCYLCQNRDNEFCYELQGIHLPPSWCLGDS